MVDAQHCGAILEDHEDPHPVGYLISEVQSPIIAEAQRLDLPVIMQILQRRSMVPPSVLPPLHGELISFFPGSKKLTEV